MVISVAGGRFKTPLDIANMACTHWGVAPLVAFSDDSVQAQVCSELYDQLRTAEMRRNVWTFSIRRAFMRPISTPGGVSSLNSGLTGLLAPAAWSATATYLHGSLVTYAGQIFQAKASVAANLQPDINPVYWQEFFGTLAVNAWATGNGGYFAGELVYTQAGRTISAFVSLSTANTDTPGTQPAWLATQTYLIGNSATLGGVTYQSQIDFNLANTPVALWLVGTTYANLAQVIGSDNHLYTSTGAGNIGHNPVGNAGVNWTDNGVAAWGIQPNTQTDTMTGLNWLLLGSATVSALNIIYPANSGPQQQTATRNAFVLPNGFLREAPQDPKAGSSSFLGAPSGLAYNDWVFGDGLLISREVNPICLRFAADVQDVSTMDPMFCEMLASRIALEGNERVNQSAEKEGVIGQKYKTFGSEARMVNGIEQGASEPPEDDYLSCRV